MWMGEQLYCKSERKARSIRNFCNCYSFVYASIATSSGILVSENSYFSQGFSMWSKFWLDDTAFFLFDNKFFVLRCPLFY